MSSGADETPRPPGRHRLLSRAERRARRAEVSDPAVVLSAATRFLEARSRSMSETRRHLVAAGYRAELVERAVRQLAELGILDDLAFSRAWVESRDRARPRGRRALRRELALMGIPDAMIAQVLVEREEPPDVDQDEPVRRDQSADERAAERLLDRKRAALARIPDLRVRRQRAYALLVRAGFESTVAARLAAAVIPTDDEGVADGE